MSTATTLYRVFDINGALLYVGISDQPWSRFRQHADDKPWWSSVAAFRFEHYERRSDALDAETAAIGAEKPMYNGWSRARVPIPRRQPTIAVPPSSNDHLDAATRATAKAQEWTERLGADVEAAYLTDGYSLSQIADRLGLTLEGVRQRLKARGVELRPRGRGKQ